MRTIAATSPGTINSTTYTRPSPRLHLLSTCAIFAWSLFIAATIVIHELADRVTWDSSRVADGRDIPWLYRPGSGLPSILRIIFAQAHGPITAMHLARLAVGALDVSWASPKTWMEVFWFADRRWAGPVGLGTTGWALVRRRSKDGASLTFWSFASLCIVALATPLVLTRAYRVETVDVKFNVVSSVMEVEDYYIKEWTMEDQLKEGNPLWSKGISVVEGFSRNAFAEAGTSSSSTQGSWLFTGDPGQDVVSLSGIRVTGQCEAVQTTSNGAGAFSEHCTAEFGPELRATTNMEGQEYSDGLYNMSSCSNIGLETPFGLVSQPGSSALFRIWNEESEVLLRCNAMAGLGSANVDGRNMTFSQFTPTAVQFDDHEWMPRDPIAAIIQGGQSSFEDSQTFKWNRKIVTSNKGYDTADIGAVSAAAMWDGILALSAILWYWTPADPEQHPGIRRSLTTGVRRDSDWCYGLFALLGFWFVGICVVSAVLIRRTWTSSFDAYAAARLLHHRPNFVAEPEAWFADLEDSEDMMEPFEMRQWR